PTALGAIGATPRDVDAIYFTSVTGIATPSIDARLANRLGFRPDVKRVPIFGLGCVAGAAGIARCADYVRAFPEHLAILLSVELCSLTLQKDDLSIPNLIASGLFGDGAACAIVTGADHPKARGPRVVATRSAFYRATEDGMGWAAGERGGTTVLSAAVAARRHARWSVARGAVEPGRAHSSAMVALHTGLLIGCAAEPRLFDRPFLPWLGIPALALVLLAQALRWWVIRALGPRWNTRIFV